MYLPDFVVATDEVAGNSYDAFLLLPQLKEGGMVEGNAADVIRRVNRMFDSRPAMPLDRLPIMPPL